MKKAILLPLCIALLLLSACAQGEPISAELFAEEMEGRGFTVEDHTEYLDPSRTEDADTEQLQARGKFFVSFDKFADSKEAENVFKAFVKYYSSGEDCDIVYKSSRYLQVEYLDYQGADKVCIASSIENTLITVYADYDIAKDAEALLEELGYGR